MQLCNVVGAAPWLNVPYIAGEDPATLRAMAALVRDQLRPDVPVYVEYSNEVRVRCWRSSSEQTSNVGNKSMAGARVWVG